MTLTYRRSVLLVCAILFGPATALSQDAAQQPPHTHEHVDVAATLLTPTRDAAGTAWLPATTPMYGVHQPWRGWDLRLAGSAFAQFVHEPTERHRTGGTETDQFSGATWGMGMLRRAVGKGRIGFRGMFSGDPWTMSNCGALSLLSTGEACEGDTVHDRQQPHDFVMELSADYEHPIGAGWRWQLYAAIAGEPAFGPPGFSHRASAAANPSAPISHHLIDPPTSFGVVTGGIHNGRWRVEASAFNGRSADESPTDIDLGDLDSTSVRLSVLPAESWALQISAGRLFDGADDFYAGPNYAADRLVASATYHRPLSQSGIWATTVAYGLSKGREPVGGRVFDILSDGVVLESSITRAQTQTLFGRAEIVAMPAHHLHAHELVNAVVTISKLQVGYVRHLRSRVGLVPGLGGAVSLALVPDSLAPRYEGNRSPGLAFFLNLRPVRHSM
jgi:hypothetical protein